jgi:hypothetical protein
MRPAVGRHSVHASVLDPEFLGQQRDLVLQTVDLGPDLGPAVPVARGSGGRAVNV